MRIVFMGTPQYAACILEELIAHHEVVGVFTRPDAVRGRGNKLVPSPVKEVALAYGIDVAETSSFSADAPYEALVAMAPDIVCVAAFGAILPPRVVDLPPLGCVNVHASALPRWRGAAPIERAILAYDEYAGVCVMKLVEQLDAGDYCNCRLTEIAHKQKDQLEDELAHLGADALVDALDAIEQGNVSWEAQDEALVTYASKVVKGELDIAPSDDARTIDAKVRASSDAHPSHAHIANRIVTIEEVDVLDPQAAGLFEGLTAGCASYRAKKLVIACEDGLIQVKRLKPQGKKSMDGNAFFAGLGKAKGEVFEWEKA